MKQTILYKKANKRNYDNKNVNYSKLNWKIDKLLIAVEKLLRSLGS